MEGAEKDEKMGMDFFTHCLLVKYSPSMMFTLFLFINERLPSSFTSDFPMKRGKGRRRVETSSFYLYIIGIHGSRISFSVCDTIPQLGSFVAIDIRSVYD